MNWKNITKIYTKENIYVYYFIVSKMEYLNVSQETYSIRSIMLARPFFKQDSKKTSEVTYINSFHLRKINSKFIL